MFLSLSQIAYATQEIERVKIFLPREIIALILSHYLPDHQTVCSVAKINKSFHAFMLGVAKNKTYAMLRCPTFRTPFANFIHKYGTATCFAHPEPWDPFTLTCGYCEFGGKNIKFNQFKGFLSKLPCASKPLFDESDNFCFYGYGNCQCTKLCGSSSGIIRYNSNGTRHFCVIYDDNRMPWNLSYLLSYPVLLEAIINTPGKEVVANDKSCSLKSLEYDLSKVMLPHNYKDRKEFNWTKDDDVPEHYGPRKRLEDFPDDIKNAIEKRYQECCQAEK